MANPYSILFQVNVLCLCAERAERSQFLKNNPGQAIEVGEEQAVDASCEISTPFISFFFRRCSFDKKLKFLPS